MRTYLMYSVYPSIASALLGLLIVLSASPASGQTAAVFQGRPMVRIGEGGLGHKEGAIEHLSPAEAEQYQCVIHNKGGRYYWASRENKELVRTSSGSFMTFMARDGSGYVRIIPPDRKAAAALMSETANKYDYIEHLLMGLVTITYYGVAQ
jgi:hypothetical protein